MSRQDVDRWQRDAVLGVFWSRSASDLPHEPFPRRDVYNLNQGRVVLLPSCCPCGPMLSPAAVSHPQPRPVPAKWRREISLRSSRWQSAAGLKQILKAFGHGRIFIVDVVFLVWIRISWGYVFRTAPPPPYQSPPCCCWSAYFECGESNMSQHRRFPPFLVLFLLPPETTAISFETTRNQQKLTTKPRNEQEGSPFAKKRDHPEKMEPTRCCSCGEKGIGWKCAMAMPSTTRYARMLKHLSSAMVLRLRRARSRWCTLVFSDRFTTHSLYHTFAPLTTGW